MSERKSASGQRVYLYVSDTLPEAGGERQQPDQVDMHMSEKCRREVETPERGLICRVILDSWLGVDARVHARQSVPTPGHINRWHTHLMVTLIPGCLRPWRGQRPGV